MSDRCEVQFSEGFVHDLPRLPRSVAKKLRTVYPRLRAQPLSGPNIKKLQRWRDLYRYRLGDHRLIYKMDSEQSRCVVTLLYLGHRKDVYRHLGHDPDHEAPTIRVVANERARPLLALPEEPTNGNGQTPTDGPRPTAGDVRLSARFPLVLDQLGITGDDRRVLDRCRTEDDLLNCGVSQKLLEMVMEALWPRPIPEVDSPLPDRFHEVLERLEVAGEDLTALQECGTEGQLLNCGVSPELLDRIIYALWPRSIDRAVDEPKRVVDSPQGLEEVVSGTRPLESFLLALDETQRPIVKRFTRRPAGPRIVKGGPGTGKSTVALYCLQSLVRPNEQRQLLTSGSAPRILFTTYTKALVSASTELLGHLGADGESVDVLNVDALARRHAESRWAKPVYRARDQVWKDIVAEVIPSLKREIGGFSWNEDDSEFLFDEINEVIVGRETGSLGEYENIKRVGRGRRRRISQKQRQHVWEFALAAWKELKKRDRCLRAHLFVDAKKHADPVYDYVFMDEAQDLPPVAIRMCVKLAKDERNVFLTADRNQSIYTSGFSWNGVQESLNMRGRSTILRRNHRTTREIIDAIRPLLADYKRVDPETLDTEFVRSGPRPELRFAGSDEVGVVARWLRQVVAEEPDLGMAHAAVLCPTNDDCKHAAKVLEASGLSASYMTGKSVDLGYDGVKVMTMHTAKGLQFPIVAVVGLEAGKLPFTDVNDPEQREDTDRWRRVFFVACSRAMRRLLVVADKARPSPFVEGFDEERWIIA